MREETPLIRDLPRLALLTALVGWALLGARFGVKVCAKALLGSG